MVKKYLQRFVGTDGANITVANSAAGGDPLNVIIFNSGTDVSASGNAFFTYSASDAREGTTGAKWTSTGITANSYASWTHAAGNGRVAVVRVPIRISAYPAATQLLLRIDTPTGPFMQLKLTNAGKLLLSGASPNVDQTTSQSTNSVPLNTDLWLEFKVVIGTTTSNGEAGYKLFTNSQADGSGTDSAVAGVSYYGTAYNMGTDAEFNTASRFRFLSPFATAIVSGSGAWTTLGTDLWQALLTTDTAAWIGPYVSVLPPVTSLSAGPPRVRIVATTSVGVSPYSHVITHVSGPSSTSDAVPVPNNDNMWEVPVPTTQDDTWQVVPTGADAQVGNSAQIVVVKAAMQLPPVVEYVRINGTFV
jgi:hypothetical protein